MRPVLVLQNLSSDGPAYLAQWLAERGAPFAVFDAEAGAAFPERIEAYGALAILGGEMSANDDLPSLRQAQALFRAALRLGVPTLGHCLGGQLMSRALGAGVGDSPAPEVGWHAIAVRDNAQARAWFGAPGEHVVFQWHYESFELPAGAQPLAASPACPNQAWALGPHLAMQFHVELDAAKLQRWLEKPDERLAAASRHHPTVHGEAAMRADAALHLAAQQALARGVYAHWIEAALARAA